MRAPSLPLLALALLAAPVLAVDIIELKNGRILEVERATVQGNKLRVQLPQKNQQFIAYTIPIDKVVPEFVFYAWREQLEAGDEKAHLRLAAWARKHGLFRQALQTYMDTAKFSAEIKESLPDLEKMMHQEAATWNFTAAERYLREGEVAAARVRAERVVRSFGDTDEGGRAKALLSIIKEREQFLSEQKLEEEIARTARKQKRTIDRQIQLVDKADRVATRVRFRYPLEAKRRLRYVAYHYQKAAGTLAELLLDIEVDQLRRMANTILGGLDRRIVGTYSKLADLYYMTGQADRALGAVHEVLAIDPDNEAAEGLRERILDGGGTSRLLPDVEPLGYGGYRVRYPVHYPGLYGYPRRHGRRVVKIGATYPVYGGKSRRPYGGSTISRYPFGLVYR